MPPPPLHHTLPYHFYFLGNIIFYNLPIASQNLPGFRAKVHFVTTELIITVLRLK